MGLGDNLMATGMARGAAKRGKAIAFGDGKKVIWDTNSAQIFDRNPNIAPRDGRARSNLEWIPFYKGNRLYNTSGGDRWIWNYEFRPVPGEMFFSDRERKFAEGYAPGFVLIEPNVPRWKSVAPNKQWPVWRFNEVAKWLIARGHEVAQFNYGIGHVIVGAKQIVTPDFRKALAILRRASLFIGPEGGLHHGAAAVGIPAVVIFGGFIPPQVTGYDTHTNLTGGAEACGSFHSCKHCQHALEKISVEEVCEAAQVHLGRVAA